LAPGNYQIVYTARVRDFVAGGTMLTNRAVLTHATGNPVTATATVRVVGDFTVRIGVYNEAGEVVKLFPVEQFSQPVENISLEADNAITSLYDVIGVYYQGYLIGTWDGTNGRNEPAPNGVYHIKIDNIDALGTVRSTTQQAMVSRTLYRSSVLIYNEAGEVVRRLWSYVDDPGQAAVNGIELSTSVFRPSYAPTGGTPSQLSIRLSNGTTVVWDGRNDSGTIVRTGQYFVEIHSVDGQGGETQVVQRVSVQGGDRTAGAGVVTAYPNVVNRAQPGPVTFVSDALFSVTLRVSLYTTAGELVVVRDGPAGQNTASWDASGVASGTYIAVVESRNAQGGLVNQQVLKVLIVR
jgi:flagellar hook assembly protein FlgD